MQRAQHAASSAGYKISTTAAGLIDERVIQVWMLLFLGAVGAAVFYSYRRGDRLTVQYVEKARDGVQTFMDRRAGRVTETSYQAL